MHGRSALFTTGLLSSPGDDILLLADDVIKDVVSFGPFKVDQPESITNYWFSDCIVILLIIVCFSWNNLFGFSII